MATSAPTPASRRWRSSSASARGGVGRREHQHGRGVRPRRTGRSRDRHLALGEPPGQRLGEHVAGQAPLGVAHRALAHQLERHHRGGLLEDQPLEVARARRRRARPPARPAAPRGRAWTPAAPASARRAPGGRARTRRPSALAARRAPRTARAPRRAAPPSRPRGAARRNVALGERLAARVEHHHRAADRGRQRPHQLVEPALLEHQPLQPLVDGDAALEHLVLLVDEPRERLLGDRDERQLVGHLEHREAERRAPRPPAPPAASSCPKPDAEAQARPGGGRPAGATNSRWRFALVSCRPVVRISSPPESHGVGSWQLGDVHPADRAPRPPPRRTPARAPSRRRGCGA